MVVVVFSVCDEISSEFFFLARDEFARSEHLYNRANIIIIGIILIKKMRKVPVWFDDGLQNASLGIEIMRKYGLIGYISIITSEVGREHQIKYRGYYHPTLSIMQLKRLIKEGWEIASIGHNFYRHFDRLSLEQTRYEAKTSKEWIIKNLGVIPKWFVVARCRLREDQIPIILEYYENIRNPNSDTKRNCVLHTRVILKCNEYQMCQKCLEERIRKL